MKNFYSLNFAIAAIAIVNVASSQVVQTTMTFQPDACHGQDAHVDSIGGILNSVNDNYGQLDEMVPNTWTFSTIGGTTGIFRAFINFIDLKLIPTGTTVVKATLSLYGKSSSETIIQGNSTYPGSPYTSYGTNECWVRRVNGADTWDESTITWANQPRTLAFHQVTLPASTSQWNYNANVDVTNIVQDMINADPSKRTGFFYTIKN